MNEFREKSSPFESLTDEQKKLIMTALELLEGIGLKEVNITYLKGKIAPDTDKSAEELPKHTQHLETLPDKEQQKDWVISLLKKLKDLINLLNSEKPETQKNVFGGLLANAKYRLSPNGIQTANEIESLLSAAPEGILTISKKKGRDIKGNEIPIYHEIDQYSPPQISKLFDWLNSIKSEFGIVEEPKKPAEIKPQKQESQPEHVQIVFSEKQQGLDKLSPFKKGNIYKTIINGLEKFFPDPYKMDQKIVRSNIFDLEAEAIRNQKLNGVSATKEIIEEFFSALRQVYTKTSILVLSADVKEADIAKLVEASKATAFDINSAEISEAKKGLSEAEINETNIQKLGIEKALKVIAYNLFIRETDTQERRNYMREILAKNPDHCQTYGIANQADLIANLAIKHFKLKVPFANELGLYLGVMSDNKRQMYLFTGSNQADTHESKSILARLYNFNVFDNSVSFTLNTNPTFSVLKPTVLMRAGDDDDWVIDLKRRGNIVYHYPKESLN